MPFDCFENQHLKVRPTLPRLLQNMASPSSHGEITVGDRKWRKEREWPAGFVIHSGEALFSQQERIRKGTAGQGPMEIWLSMPYVKGADEHMWRQNPCKQTKPFPEQGFDGKKQGPLQPDP
jgi:hypothetical protein